MTSDVSRVSEEIEVELTYLSFLGLSPAAALSVFTAGMLISLQSHKIRHINSRQCINVVCQFNKTIGSDTRETFNLLIRVLDH